MSLYTYAFSPLPPYVFGVGSLAQGLRALLWPQHEYAFYFGVRPPTCAPEKEGTASSNKVQQTTRSQTLFACCKGARDIGCGLVLIRAQYQGNALAVTIAALVWAGLAVGDGLVVWQKNRGRRGYKDGLLLSNKCLVGSLGIGWAGLRLFLAYGEWAAFLALHC